MIKWLVAIIVILLSSPTSAAPELFQWSQLPDIPAERGLGGPFAGVHEGVHFVAGGANFPDAPPWEGGSKVWLDGVYTLAPSASHWRATKSLPRPSAYGTSHSTRDGILLVGGGDSTTHDSRVVRVTLGSGEPVFEDLPLLPYPLAFHSSAIVGDTLYVCGGISEPTATEARNDLIALDLANLEAGWNSLPALPGAGRIMPVSAELDGFFYIVGGASLAPDADEKPKRTYLLDGYRFSPKTAVWSPIAAMPRLAVAAPVPAPQIGPTHFAVLGGDTGENLPPAVALPDHPGFSRDILAYHSITDTWATKGQLPFGQVTTVAYRTADGEVVVPSGEVRPGVRTPAVWVGALQSPKTNFGLINYITIGIYFVGVAVLGLALGGRNASTDDYFRGGQHIPWWAAGLSIFATMSSSIGYLAIPAKAYATDWVYVLTALPILLLAPIVIRFYLPFFRRIDATSAYEFLELRFNTATRMFGSVTFLLFHLGRMAIVLYLPALAIQTVTNLDPTTCILLMGGFCLLYSGAGGVRAVIWTDVIQSFVLLGGLIISLVWIVAHIEGGVGSFFSLAAEEGKFRIVENSWSPTTTALWVVLIGNLFSNLLPYTSDQAVVQRYMTTKSEKAAARSIWTNAILSMPNTLLMFLIGTGLYVFYKHHPERLASGINTDAIFPLFIARELPVGIAGLAVAGILAAAQSTVSTSINSISTVAMVDVVGRFGLTREGQSDLRLAKIISYVAGAAGTVMALWLAQKEGSSLWDTYWKLLGLASGPLAGVFALGIFTRRANGVGSLAGILAAIPTLWWVQEHTPIHFFLYAAVGVTVTVVVGYAASLLTETDPEKVEGLTLYTLRERTGAEKQSAAEQSASVA